MTEQDQLLHLHQLYCKACDRARGEWLAQACPTYGPVFPPLVTTQDALKAEDNNAWGTDRQRLLAIPCKAL
jgi:hypothetical protein